MAHKINAHVCNLDELINPPVTINSPNCDGSTSPIIVSEVVGVHVLNPYKFHTEVLYDAINASLGGNITYTYTAPRNVSLNLNTVTITNDSLIGFWTDFGDGYNDFGNVPSHSYNADGSYEIKTYAILNSRNKILINAKEVTIVSGVITYAPIGNVSVVSRPYKHSVNAVLQNYCGSTPQGTPYLANGVTYIPTGTLSVLREIIIDELESNGDYQTSVSGTITPTLVTPTYSANRTLFTINTIPAAYNIPVPVNTREITIQNITTSDITVTTSQGTQILATRGTLILANPIDTTINHAIFTGNVGISFFNSVGGNISGVQPRVIVDFKTY
jgi:hypothetical protein